MTNMDASITSVNNYGVCLSDFNVICRLCLTKHSEPPLNKINDRVMALLKDLADIEILEGDELPTNICNNCMQTLDMVQNFLTHCKRSHTILTDILLKQKTLKETYQVVNFKTHKSKETEDDSQNAQFKPPADEPANKNTYCKNCNLSFKTKFYLRTHYKNTRICRPSEWKVHQCEYCSKEFITLRDKVEHHNVHTGQTPYKCSYCPRAFKFKSKLRQHIYRHQLELGLVENISIYKEKRVRLKLRCHKCEKVFSSRSGFQYHKLRHEGKILQKTPNFKNKKTVKKFLCNYCAKSFYMKSNLDAHLRTHTGENPYKCDYCPKEFRQRSSLTRHNLCHVDERMFFLCKVCDKKFTTKAHRDIHARIHTGEKPYQCDFCQKSFNYKTQWRIHLRLHTGETPFTCAACGKAYHDKGSLRKHQKKKSHFPLESDCTLDTGQDSEGKEVDCK